MATEGKYNGWIVAGIFNGLQKLSIPIFGVISTMLLAKEALSKEQMGVWALFLTITSFVDQIRTALVKTSLIKYVNHSTEDEHKYVLSGALFINAIITIVLILLLGIFAHSLSMLLKAPELESMMYIFLIGMALLIPFSHFEWILYGKSEFKGLFWTYFVRQGIGLLLMLIFLLLKIHISLDMLVIFFCIGILLAMVIAYFYTRPHLTNSFALSGEWLKKLWHFGKYVFGSGISSWVFNNVGQMMLSPILGNTLFTASQSIANRVINLADIPSQVLSDILFPKSANKDNVGNKDLIKYYYEKTVGATLAFILPTVAFILIFPKFIILVLADKQYFDAIPYLQLVAITGIFLAYLKQWGVIIDSSGRPQVNFLLITFIAVIHILFTYLLVKGYGFLGSAYALIFTHLIAFIITQWLLNKYYGIKFMNCFKYAFQFYPEMLNVVIEKVQLKWKKA